MVTRKGMGWLASEEAGIGSRAGCAGAGTGEQLPDGRRLLAEVFFGGGVQLAGAAAGQQGRGLR